jgi:hypothetical protein
MAKVRIGKSVWPSPVYVADFHGGEHVRMSFWQPLGKPWRFAAARGMVQQVIGNERVITQMREQGEWRQWRTCGNPPATDIISGHVEHQGRTYLDPYFDTLLFRMESPREPRDEEPRRIAYR